MKLLLIDDCERFPEELLKLELEEFFIYTLHEGVTDAGLNAAIQWQMEEWQSGPIMVAWTSTILPEDIIEELSTSNQDLIVTGKGRVNADRPPRELALRKGRILPSSEVYHSDSILDVYLIQRPQDLEFIPDEDGRTFTEVFVNSISPNILSCNGFKIVGDTNGLA